MPRIAWLMLLVLAGCPRPLPAPIKPRPVSPPPILIPPGCEQPLSGDWQHLDEPSFRYHFEDDGEEVTGWVYRVFAPSAVDAGRPSRLFPRSEALTAGGSDAGVRKSKPSTDAGVGQAIRGGDAGGLEASTDGGAADGGIPDAGSTPSSLDSARDDGDAHHHPLPSELLPQDGGAAPLATAVLHLRRTPEGFVGEAETHHLLPSGRECRATFATRVTACGPSSLTLASATSTPVGEGCQSPSSPQPAAMLEHRLARTDAGAL